MRLIALQVTFQAEVSLDEVKRAGLSHIFVGHIEQAGVDWIVSVSVDISSSARSTYSECQRGFSGNRDGHRKVSRARLIKLIHDEKLAQPELALGRLLACEVCGPGLQRYDSAYLHRSFASQIQEVGKSGAKLICSLLCLDRDSSIVDDFHNLGFVFIATWH